MSIRRVALIGLALLTAACDPGPPAPVKLQVALAWDTQNAVLSSDLTTITTDTGYVVELDRLTVTTYSIELMSCEPLPPPRAAFNLIGTARAGHQVGHPPTRTTAAGIENPLKSSTMVMDRIAPPDVAYCGAHYLIGRLLDAPPGADAAETTGFSLRAHGRYRKADQDTWTPLALDSAVAHGILINFDAPKTGVRFKDGDTVVVTRRLSSMFNGIDFAAMDESAVVRQTLRHLVATTAVTWHPASPG